MTYRSIISERQLVITDADFDRLKHLVGSPRYRGTHLRQLTALDEELVRGSVVAREEVPKGVVTMHSRVRVRDLEEDEPETYTLVYPDEADIDAGRLSVLAPLGTALLGTRVGEVVEFDVPAGTRRVKVDRVLYQPEAAGDFHL
jgi:regulator of nucleoside diphosphate kinase